MAISISLALIIPITLVVLILIFVFWVLYTKNKRLGDKLTERRKKFMSYQKVIKDLEDNPKGPEKDFKTLNNAARDFFHEYFRLKYSATYLKLEKYFKKHDKPQYAEFCKKMSDLDYKEEKKEAEKIKTLVKLFSEMIEEQK